MYLNQLNDAIAYAEKNGSFNKINLIEQAENVCVFGLGTYFKEAFASQKMKEKYHVNLLCDNDSSKWGNEYEGIKCVNPEELKEYKNLVVIIMMGNPIPVQKQLASMGIISMSHNDLMLDDIMELPRSQEWFLKEEEKIRTVYGLFEDNSSKMVYVNGLCNRIAPPISKALWDELYTSEAQYFNQKYFGFTKNEVYVDCGAYTGDTIIEFCKIVEEYDKIFGFELDRNNFVQMRQNVTGLGENIVLYNYGVWNENKQIDYGIGTSDNEPAGGISIYKTEESKNNDIQKGQVVRLDDILKDERISFIKMDVEGSEKCALLGAESIIRKQNPKLAICVYHKTSDFWEIPLLLKKFNQEYKFALRHHMKQNCNETVIYAY